ncbi:hypothetical protein OH76DRAFT_1402711 [Lentinus brumalis]|uniref:F-box domain-containing protein n=1 Tax=Lentinus brumalis TaxID=2498619 RepID=A0A371DCH5_9APHY|nr:hypothetical protein OH76DRAFT_1402711 [Polyporus brumalis]
MPDYPIALRNSDVWHLILSVVDRKTRLALVQTCHILNQQAAPYLLGDVVLQGLGPRKLSSFLQFIAPRDDDEQSAYRLRSLRGLSLQIVNLPPSIDALLALFARLQQHGTDLTRLRISVSDMATTPLNTETPRLGEAIASLQHIRDLELELSHPLCYEILHATRSRLVSLKLRSRGQAVNPIPLLLNSQDTLEKLDTNLPWNDSGPCPCYPRVRDLTLKCTVLPRTMYFVGAFPNLQALRISSLGEPSAETPRWHESTFPLLRLFSGSFNDLYVLGVRHRLNNLKIHIGHSLDDFSQLRAVLSESSPSCLSLEIGQLRGGQCLTNAAFISLFSPSLLPRLSTLALDCKWGSHEDTDPDAIEEALAVIAMSLPLKTFKVVLRLQDLRYHARGHLEWKLDIWDAEDLADQLLDRQPFLMSSNVEIAVDPYTPNRATLRRPSAGPS